MPENNDTNAAAATPGDTGSTASATNPGPQRPTPDPIFESFIYDFVKPGLAGNGGGRPGTIGGPIGGKEPVYRVLTYPFLPHEPPDIEKT